MKTLEYWKQIYAGYGLPLNEELHNGVFNAGVIVGEEKGDMQGFKRGFNEGRILGMKESAEINNYIKQCAYMQQSESSQPPRRWGRGDMKPFYLTDRMLDANPFDWTFQTPLGRIFYILIFIPAFILWAFSVALSVLILALPITIFNYIKNGDKP